MPDTCFFACKDILLHYVVVPQLFMCHGHSTFPLVYLSDPYRGGERRRGGAVSVCHGTMSFSQKERETENNKEISFWVAWTLAWTLACTWTSPVLLTPDQAIQ